MASRDAAKFLDAAEETFDEIAIFAQMLIEMALDKSMTAGWNNGFNVFGVQMFEDGVASVS